MHFTPTVPDPVTRTTRDGRTGAAMIALGIVLGALLALAGCGYSQTVQDGGPVSTTATTLAQNGETTSSTAPDTSSTTLSGETVPGETVQFSVYFVLNEKMHAIHRTVPYTKQTAAAAVQALVAGPTPEEAQLGIFTAIPDGTLLLGVNIEGPTATVDLSREYESGGGSLSMGLRLAQVVYTLTQFPSVETVQFKLDGKPITVFGGEGFLLEHPVGRLDYEDYTPAILVESPTIGDVVTSPLRVHGTSNTFEATSQLQIVDADGRTLVDQFVTATSGTGTRGTWDVTVPFTAEPGTIISLITFEYSAKDGSMINVTEIPLMVGR